jgi:hypothetical protein
VDILAHHDYIGYADHHRIDRGVPLGDARSAYVKMHKRTKRPIAVTEFGNMGSGAEEVTGEKAVWAGSLSTARLVIEGLNAGADGFLRWEFKPYGVSWQNFGALTTLTKKHVFEPYRPVFFPQALLCRAAPRGASILKTTLEGGSDENRVPRVVCAALYHRKRGLALLLVNDGFEPKQVTVRFGRRFPEAVPGRFGHLSYDASLPASFVRHEPVVAEDGLLALSLPPRSVHALATWPGFAEVADLPLLPPRVEPVYSSTTAGGVSRYTARMEFNGDYQWRVWQSTAGHTSFKTAKARGDAEEQVCRITYDFVGVKPGQREEHVVAHTDLMVDGRPRRVRFRLRGDGGHLRLRPLFLDARGEVFEFPAATTIRWTGWDEVEKDLDAPFADWNHWNGDGKADLPFRGFGFSLTAPSAEFRRRGILELDNVVVTSESRAE